MFINHSITVRRRDKHARPWQLAHLTQLTELTLQGEQSGLAMDELLSSPCQPVLPASLQVLRWQTHAHDTLCPSGTLRAEGLASTTIPVLVIRAGSVECSYLNASELREQHARAPLETGDLPAGFGALWLRTSLIVLGNPDDEGRVRLIGTGDDAAQQLLYFLEQAPRSYREFCICGDDESSGLTVEAGSLFFPDAVGVFKAGAFSFDSLEAAAGAMRQFAPDHGLAVSICDDQTYLRVRRL